MGETDRGAREGEEEEPDKAAGNTVGPTLGNARSLLEKAENVFRGSIDDMNGSITTNPF